MAQTQSRFCRTCGKFTLHQKDEVSAAQMLVHILLFFVTCGLWGFVIGLILLTDTIQPYKCSFCGNKNPKKPPVQVKPQNARANFSQNRQFNKKE